MTTLKPDIIATVHFAPTDKGGRESPIIQPVFGCIFEHGEQANDCRLLLEGKGDIWPGQKITIPMLFLCPDLVRPRIKVGDRFQLREARVIAHGVIDEIMFE
ncbi:MAG: hypothetical protein HZC55_00440 [Verrucomicrobia bacterium]|nr:hypothetical protein [Verrucomicrobiota bacterium]